MLTSFLAVLVFSTAAPDTTVNLGVVRRDLTGDGVPETLSLTGRGRTIDTLDVTFTIASADRPLYSTTVRLTRRTFDPRRRLSDAEYRTRLNEYGGWFFADAKFMSTEGFVAKLRSSARLRIAMIPEVIAPGDSARGRKLWEEMQRAGVTVFEFATGGDGVTTIGWSATDQRFYRLWECC